MAILIMMLELWMLILVLTPCIVQGENVPDTNNATDNAETLNILNSNSTDPNKDMYVIHAMVYQVGILTNRTDESNDTNQIGNQEAVTFFHNNGSGIDLSNIPAPLMTNVTAQRLVEVAPVSGNNGDTSPLSWDHLKSLAQDQQSTSMTKPVTSRGIRDADYSEDNFDSSRGFYPYLTKLFKRSSNSENSNDASETKTPVKIVSGAAVVPQSAGLNSISIPPLLSLNNNFSEIPVPIPNTSVVHYAKVNTIVQQPT